MSKIASFRALTAFAIGLAAAPATYAQSVYTPPPRDKNWTESQPLYQPYTGPGFGNPDKPKDQQPVGQSKKKYNDAAGTSAYSSGGNPEATNLGPKPKKAKVKDPKPDNGPQ